MSMVRSTTEQYELALTLPVAALSFLGSASIMLTFFAYRDSLQSISRRLIFFLSVSDICQSIFFLIPVTSMRVPCVILSMFGMFSALSSFLWTVAIAHFVSKTVRDSLDIQQSYPRWYHYVCWGYPVATILIVLFTAPTWSPNNESIFDVFGADSSVGWCFIPNEYPNQRLLSIYLPLSVCWVLTTYFYLSARSKIQELSIGLLSTPLLVQRADALQEVMQKLALIPFGFIMLRCWGAVYRLMDRFRPSSQSDTDFAAQHRWLGILTALGDPAQGFFNFIVFIVMNRNMRTRFVSLFRCCTNSSNEPSIELLSSSDCVVACCRFCCLEQDDNHDTSGSKSADVVRQNYDEIPTR
jgi:hypothetical protein